MPEADRRELVLRPPQATGLWAGTAGRVLPRLDLPTHTRVIPCPAEMLQAGGWVQRLSDARPQIELLRLFCFCPGTRIILMYDDEDSRRRQLHVSSLASSLFPSWHDVIREGIAPKLMQI
jgi:hypothetical protein